jgi:hypothetical protein
MRLDREKMATFAGVCDTLGCGRDLVDRMIGDLPHRYVGDGKAIVAWDKADVRRALLEGTRTYRRAIPVPASDPRATGGIHAPTVDDLEAYGVEIDPKRWNSKRRAPSVEVETPAWVADAIAGADLYTRLPFLTMREVAERAAPMRAKPSLEMGYRRVWNRCMYEIEIWGKMFYACDPELEAAVERGEAFVRIAACDLAEADGAPSLLA